jgi:hypothetical protein
LIPGDILLGVIDDSLVPGKWSHVAIYAGDGDIIEAPAEDGCVEERIVDDWSSPDKTWVAYLRVVTADTGERLGAVEFARSQEAKCAPYDVRLYTKQAYGESWYCSELIWAAYLDGSGGRINLEDAGWGRGTVEIASSRRCARSGALRKALPPDPTSTRLKAGRPPLRLSSGSAVGICPRTLRRENQGVHRIEPFVNVWRCILRARRQG